MRRRHIIEAPPGGSDAWRGAAFVAHRRAVRERYAVALKVRAMYFRIHGHMAVALARQRRLAFHLAPHALGFAASADATRQRHAAHGQLRQPDQPAPTQPLAHHHQPTGKRGGAFPAVDVLRGGFVEQLLHHLRLPQKASG
ncbi:conserved hypothetical protein [Stutzerimonas stutzeri A1501]|uniref:Uncharacterized protein n=1 Tax=Stutzerimonas stutzeri (strain A1501) TaxID=379731 RepID=A4VKV1_STUS1|nr:conserved hypothetical protein [Stutzerimonas stutzeri A1501]